MILVGAITLALAKVAAVQELFAAKGHVVNALGL
jgi:hypothetical protein